MGKEVRDRFEKYNKYFSGPHIRPQLKPFLFLNERLKIGRVEASSRPSYCRHSWLLTTRTPLGKSTRRARKAITQSWMDGWMDRFKVLCSLNQSHCWLSPPQPYSRSSRASGWGCDSEGASGIFSCRPLTRSVRPSSWLGQNSSATIQRPRD